MNLHHPCVEVVWKPSQHFQIKVSIPKWALIGLMASLVGGSVVKQIIPAIIPHPTSLKTVTAP